MAVTAYGDPLTLLDLPEPDLPPGFALLDVLASGVCFTDVKIARGRMPSSADLALPHVPGHEVCAAVVGTNPPGVLATGTRAIVYQYWSCGRCPACRRGHDAMCSSLEGWMGFRDPGGFEERLIAPVDRLIPVPTSVDPIHAAPMSCALGTAYRSVVTRGGVRAANRVAVIGLGGVGIHAAQVAIASGAHVVGFDVHDPTLTRAGELGIDARRSDDAEAIAATIDETGGEGVDVVIETVAHEATLSLANALVRKGGRIVAVGHAPTTALTLPTVRLVLDEVEIVGSRYASLDEMHRAVALVADGRVRPVVGLVRPLEEVNEVLEALESGEVVGRAVLDVSSGS
ncbi:MAG: zinc-binding dehydrogenase [Actinomycetota bacterium]